MESRFIVFAPSDQYSVTPATKKASSRCDRANVPAFRSHLFDLDSAFSLRVDRRAQPRAGSSALLDRRDLCLAQRNVLTPIREGSLRDRDQFSDLAVRPTESAQLASHVGALASMEPVPPLGLTEEAGRRDRFHPDTVSRPSDGNGELGGCALTQEPVLLAARFRRAPPLAQWKRRAVAQLGSARALGARSRRFESGQPDGSRLLIRVCGLPSAVRHQPAELAPALSSRYLAGVAQWQSPSLPSWL